MIKSILLLSALLASTCEVGPFPKPPEEHLPPSPWEDWEKSKDAGAPVIVVDDASPCGRACQRLAKLGCSEAVPTPRGETCAQVCANIESSGVVSMAPECVARAFSCVGARACGQ